MLNSHRTKGQHIEESVTLRQPVMKFGKLGVHRQKDEQCRPWRKQALKRG